MMQPELLLMGISGDTVEMSHTTSCQRLCRLTSALCVRVCVCVSLSWCAPVIVKTEGNGRPLSPSLFLQCCSKQTKKRKSLPLMKIRVNMFICACVCACLSMAVHMCFLCVSMCVWVCVHNAKRQLNLLPLIGGILRPRQKTQPISCDTAVTSCRPVFHGHCPSHTLD